METSATLLSLTGTVAAVQHEPITAAKLWSASERARRDIHEDTLAAKLQERWHPEARASADQTDWDAAWRAGAELDLDAALALAHRATEPVRN